MAVRPIASNTQRELIRTALEQLILGNVPIVGGALASLGRVIAPSALDQELARWRTDITDKINELDTLLAHLVGSVQISELAMQIGIYVSSQSAHGIRETYSVDDLVAAFPSATVGQLQEACGELEHAGLAKLRVLINSAGRLVLTEHFFATFDPFVHGWYPMVDAAALADYVADNSANGGVLASDMAEHFGWTPRRLNPALQIVAQYIDDARKSTAYCPPWAHRHMWADPAERARLRHFARVVRE